MRNIFTIARKEFNSFFHTWLGFMVCLFFFALAGIFFTLVVLSYVKISTDPAMSIQAQGLSQTHYVFGSFFVNLSTVLIFLVPLLTMRSFSDEKRSETLELLFTYPISDWEFVLGKHLGLIWVYELLILPLLSYGLIFQMLGGTFDWPVLLLGFIGFWLLGGFYISLGVFVSSLTKSPVISALVTFGFLIIFWVLEWVAKISDGVWAILFRELSPLEHYRYFTMGSFRLEDALYFVFLQIFFAVLSWLSVSQRNWKNI